MVEITTAIVEVYNMELVLATILALMGVLWTGNLVSFSIGGVDPKVSGLLGLLGMFHVAPLPNVASDGT